MVIAYARQIELYTFNSKYQLFLNTRVSESTSTELNCSQLHYQWSPLELTSYVERVISLDKSGYSISMLFEVQFI